MPYKDTEKQKQAQRDWVRQKRAEKQGSTELPQALLDDIAEVATDEDDKQKRIARAKQYRRLFPDRVYHSSRFTGDSRPDLAIQARLGKYTEQGNIRVAKPGDAEYVGVAEAVMARQETR